MRYIPKHKKLIVGQIRHKTKFLLFPKKIGDEWRWLEKATYEQTVEALDIGGSMEWGKYKNCWCDTKWI